MVVTAAATPVTDCVNGRDVLAANLLSPRYFAVMARVPAATAFVVFEAVPAAFSVAVPRETMPSKNSTRPVGVPPVPVTVVVNVRFAP